MSNNMHKPLEGIKVLDMTRVLAGPYCTMMLSNMGAEIIKIEAPGTGDDARAYGPFVGKESGYFLSINRGKKSVVVNMKSDEGRKVFEGLVAQVDLIVENFKPGTMEKLGYGYETLKEMHPELIYVAMSGFGHTGPYSKRPAYDMIVQGMGGIMSITGEPGKDPVRVGTSVGDVVAGMFGAYGAVNALYARRDTGRGQKVDVAMLDCQLAILENAIAKTSILGKAPGPLGLKHPSITPFEGYKTADSWIIVACGNDKLWKAFCGVTGKEELIEDPRFVTNNDRTNNMDELSAIMGEVMKLKTTDEWVELLNAVNIPNGPINTIDRLFNDPQIAERNMLVEVEQPGMGLVKVAGNPVKLSEIPKEEEVAHDPAPTLGAHTVSVLEEMLGYSPEEAKAYAEKFN